MSAWPSLVLSSHFLWGRLSWYRLRKCLLRGYRGQHQSRRYCVQRWFAWDPAFQGDRSRVFLTRAGETVWGHRGSSVAYIPCFSSHFTLCPSGPLLIRADRRGFKGRQLLYLFDQCRGQGRRRWRTGHWKSSVSLQQRSFDRSQLQIVEDILWLTI